MRWSSTSTTLPSSRADRNKYDTINYDAQVTIVCELSNKPVIDEMPEFTFHTDRFIWWPSLSDLFTRVIHNDILNKEIQSSLGIKNQRDKNTI